MPKRTYQVRILDSWRTKGAPVETHLRPVQGTPVKNEWGLALFVHKNVIWTETWSVSEATTGFEVAHGQLRAQAIAAALTKIRAAGIDQTRASIARAIAEHGAIPQEAM
jgi:hypothetical protein